MNTLGKALTVIIVLAAVCLACVSVMVYATHKNWKTEAEKLRTQLSEAQNQNEQLESKYRSLDSTQKALIEAEKQNLRKLESERTQLLAQNSAIQTQLDGLLQEQRKNIANVASTQANNEELTKEVASLQASLRANQQKRDEAFSTMVKATDALHQAQGKLSALVERNGQLTQDVAAKSSLLRENGFDPTATPGAEVPQIRGLVSAIHRTAGNQLIEITVGADDGLKPAHTVEVFRGERYLGRAEILRTEPDRAVGRIIRKFQQGTIQEGDHVATKLRIS